MSNTILNRETFYTDPADYKLANQGVAKISFPPALEAMETLKGELSTFVCDGAYADGLSRILQAFLGSVGNAGSSPAVWISGFYGSGKSHLASMLAALWTNIEFSDGATAEGLIKHLPPEVRAPLIELRTAAKRAGGVVAAGDTLGTGPSDPAEAALGIILRAVGLPSDLRAAQVALWLASLDILDAVRKDLGDKFLTDIRNFILSPRFSAAVLNAKPELASSAKALSSLLQSQFPEPPPVTVDLLETMARQALTLGRKEMPLTLIVLDEVQQFIRQDPGLTLKIQTMAERLSSRFDGRLLLVATGQQALSDVDNLQKLLDRFPVQIALGEADVDAVIRKTVLLKKTEKEKDIRGMLSANAGEISRHLRGSRLAHTVQDENEAILDWPLLPSRRRVWERILRELDRTGLGGTLRGQLRTTLDAARTYGKMPLGYAVPVDFLYGRFATEAYNAGLLPSETRNRIEALKGGDDKDKLKARILMLVYMLGRIAPEADHHGVRAQPETIADLLIVNLAGDDEIRRRVPDLLEELRADGAVIEVGGEWRLQTKESAEWEAAYRSEERTILADQSGLGRTRRDLLSESIETALSGAASVTQGASRQQRRIHRLQLDEKAPGDGIALRLRSGWGEDMAAVEKEISAASTSDATVHLLISRHPTRDNELTTALTTWRAAEHVLQLRGVPQTDAGREAQLAMLSRANKAQVAAKDIIREAVAQARVLQAGGKQINGAPADAVKEAATNALARLYPQFADGDHANWDKVRDRAVRKDPDAMKAVDHVGAPENHPVCKALLADLGPGRKGSDLRAKFTSPPYGWSGDVVDGALLVLANAGLLRVTGDDGKPASLPDIPRQKIGTCTFRAETIIITIAQRMPVRGLLTDTGIAFENNQEHLALSALLDRLESAALQSGGDAPAPEAEKVPKLAAYKGMSGNDLLAALAVDATTLRDRLKAWKAAGEKISRRLPSWQLAERLIRLGATEQSGDLESIRMGRRLLAEPDAVPPLLGAASDNLRMKLNAAYAAWDAAWTTGEQRLAGEQTWAKLSPEQKRSIRQQTGLLLVAKPTVDTPQSIVDTLSQRGLSEWEHMVKALPARIDDALASAATLLEPKARTVSLPAVMVRTEAEVDEWLKKVRTKIMAALADGPAVPRI
ncbi:BREX system P-loop protein BrxC [Bradyrhizobium sp. URHA0013]|uniref:BREX system P-loop protein BrxC n=1 Tax=Bradyrhizobium sp. URHA0013 TaxID=1380352 RepID=UPI000481D045|nr:BREX system P-loop protein BrxC [Bradyrhizobium sp. URHA0013]